MATKKAPKAQHAARVASSRRPEAEAAANRENARLATEGGEIKGKRGAKP